jgi:hypothetical protein
MLSVKGNLIQGQSQSRSFGRVEQYQITPEPRIKKAAIKEQRLS